MSSAKNTRTVHFFCLLFVDFIIASYVIERKIILRKSTNYILILDWVSRDHWNLLNLNVEKKIDGEHFDKSRFTSCALGKFPLTSWNTIYFITYLICCYVFSSFKWSKFEENFADIYFFSHNVLREFWWLQNYDHKAFWMNDWKFHE